MQNDHDYWLQWIISDYTPFNYAGRSYYLSTPAPDVRFAAERIYVVTHEQALMDGLLSEREVNDMLKKYGTWNVEKAEQLDGLVKDIEELKVQLYQSYTRSDQIKKLKSALRDVQSYMGRLLTDRMSFDQFSAKSAATFAKQHFLVGSSIHRKQASTAKKVALRGNWWTSADDILIQTAYVVLADYILSETDYRELARGFAWRTIWNNRKACGNLFGRATINLSAQQRQLVMWSSIYDSVYKNSECPPDCVIEDDDTLDGWMILQKRKRDSELNKATVEGGIVNEKIRNSEEVYVLCDEQNIKQVYDCNDITGKIRLRSILNQVQKEGHVDYMGLNDTKAELRRKYVENVR